MGEKISSGFFSKSGNKFLTVGWGATSFLLTEGIASRYTIHAL